MKNKYKHDEKRTIKQRIIDMCKYIVRECQDVKTLIVFLIVVIIVYFPVWGGYIFFYLTKNYVALAVATACLAFWAGPFTPFFPLCVMITLFIKAKYINVKKEIKEKRNLRLKKREERRGNRVFKGKKIKEKDKSKDEV